MTEEEYHFDDKAEEVAKSRGQIVVYPKENQLQLDFDNQEAFNDLEDQVRVTCPDTKDYPIIEVTVSRSGLPHRHVTLTFLGVHFTEPERILRQLALGSDPIREKLNAMRYFAGVPNPTRLFENKPK